MSVLFCLWYIFCFFFFTHNQCDFICGYKRSFPRYLSVENLKNFQIIDGWLIGGYWVIEALHYLKVTSMINGMTTPLAVDVAWVLHMSILHADYILLKLLCLYLHIFCSSIDQFWKSFEISSRNISNSNISMFNF